MKRMWMVGFLVAAMALTGCVPATETGNPPVVTYPPTDQAYVDNVDVLILESFPVQVRVMIQGNLPDACSVISDVKQTRSGSIFTIDLIVTRDPLAKCAQVLTPFEQSVGLDVDGLPAGTYSVEVEGVTTSFTLDVDNVLPPEEPQALIPVQETDVQFVMAQQDVAILAGPGAEYAEVGQVFAGQTARVTGVSEDGQWWRVICPDDNIGNCFVPADPQLTQPAAPPG
jgi:inhibitor of cysteine peptidase